MSDTNTAPTLRAYWKQCKYLDWYCAFSDDYSVTRRGEAEIARVRALGKALGAEYEAIFDGWKRYYFTGKSWGNEHQPAPAEPQD